MRPPAHPRTGLSSLKHKFIRLCPYRNLACGSIAMGDPIEAAHRDQGIGQNAGSMLHLTICTKAYYCCLQHSSHSAGRLRTFHLTQSSSLIQSQPRQPSTTSTPWLFIPIAIVRPTKRSGLAGLDTWMVPRAMRQSVWAKIMQKLLWLWTRWCCFNRAQSSQPEDAQHTAWFSDRLSICLHSLHWSPLGTFSC